MDEAKTTNVRTRTTTNCTPLRALRPFGHGMYIGRVDTCTCTLYDYYLYSHLSTTAYIVCPLGKVPGRDKGCTLCANTYIHVFK